MNQKTKKQPYCMWLAQSNQQFIKSLKDAGITPTYGFEVQDHINAFTPGMVPLKISWLSIFDVPDMRGLVFDDSAQQFVLYQYQHKFYQSWMNNEILPDNVFAYKIFPYSTIVKAEAEEQRKSYQSTYIKPVSGVGDALLGGIIAGTAGAIVASSLTTKEVVTDHREEVLSASLTVHTNEPGYEQIRFIANRGGGEDLGFDDASIEFGDAMRSTFSDVPFSSYERNITRKYGTKKDLVFTRGDQSKAIWTANVHAIYGNFQQTASRINELVNSRKDDVPRQEQNENQWNLAPVESLRNLKLMLDEGLITQSEYDSKKTEILSRM